MIYLGHEYNISEQRWEFTLTKDSKYFMPAYLNPSLSETDKYYYLVNWLNQCFRQIVEYDAKETPSQSV